MTGAPPDPVSRSVGARPLFLHLLWILPVLVGEYIWLLVAAQIMKCGISGCSGGGFGVSYDPVGAAGLVIFAGLVTGSLLGFFPWSQNRLLRIVVGATGMVIVWVTLTFSVFG